MSSLISYSPPTLTYLPVLTELEFASDWPRPRSPGGLEDNLTVWSGVFYLLFLEATRIKLISGVLWQFEPCGTFRRNLQYGHKIKLE